MFHLYHKRFDRFKSDSYYNNLVKNFDFKFAEDGKTKMLNNITIGVLTKNNEDTLERTLKSIKDKFPILIVDSGSTDKTRDIAEKYNAEFIFNKFISYSEQRNFLQKNLILTMFFFLIPMRH